MRDSFHEKFCMSTMTSDRSAGEIPEAAFKTGFIISPRADAAWFLLLPFAAIAIALAFQQWFTAVAIAAVNLWITVPHHCATWVRAYGLPEERRRWRTRLIVGPLIIFAVTLAGLNWAPITVLMVMLLWDAQHSLMQQHGFARIYDFKAGTGSPATSRFDLALHWILFGNLFLTAPFFTPNWLRELYQMNLPVSVETVRTIALVSWTVTGVYLCVYGGHVVWCLLRGYRLNPIKYLFIGASYFMWYFAAWHVATVLVYTIAHSIMHGMQYIVFVYFYLGRKTRREERTDSWIGGFARSGNLAAFAVIFLVYAVIYQIIVGDPLAEFGFGLVNFGANYAAIPEHGIASMDQAASFDYSASLVIYTLAMMHYYIDSFIWKVRDRTTQSGF